MQIWTLQVRAKSDDSILYYSYELHLKRSFLNSLYANAIALSTSIHEDTLKVIDLYWPFSGSGTCML